LEGAAPAKGRTITSSGGEDNMNDGDGGSNGKAQVEAELVETPGPERIGHLAANRSLIVKRSLLATAIGGVIPIPVVDEYVAGRVRAGLLLKLAEQRKVDIAPSSAELMGDPREGSTVRNATVTAMTLIALRLAWRKFFAVLAVGRGAEEMATTFQFATVFDHYCSQLHVGGQIDRERAAALRAVIHDTIADHEKAALVAIFREGGKTLGRSILEAPGWVQTRLVTLAQRWISTRGDVSATLDPSAGLPDGAESQWLDRAAATVDGRLQGLSVYLAELIGDFETRWKAVQASLDIKATPPPRPPGVDRSSSAN
jgi:hypothetical protein